MRRSSAVFADALHWISSIIDIAAVCGIASVVFAFMLGAARIWFALARDGLLPGWFAKIASEIRHAVLARPCCWACSPPWRRACCRSARWPSW